MRACPAHAHWIDHEPITDVIALGGIVDRYRRFVTPRGPVATGVVALADAWACTNLSLGRGMTLALMHAQYLRDCVRYHLEHPRELAEVWDTVTEAELTELVAAGTFVLWAVDVVIGMMRADRRLGHDLFTGVTLVRRL